MDANATLGNRKWGVLVAAFTGMSNAYGIGNIEDRGVLFIEPHEEVYEGQIVGECNREEDMSVNVAKQKNLTNMREANKEVTIVLKKPRRMSLEVCLDYINDDELVEITPRSVRLRKRILDTVERKKWDAKNK